MVWMRGKARKAVICGLVIVAVVMGLLVVMYAVGAMLPETHTATRVARFRAAPETVFALISGPQDWRVTCEPVATAAGEPRRWKEFFGHRAILFEEVKREPARLYETRIADPALPFGGTWRFELSPENGGTRVRVTEEGVVRSPMFRFMSRYVMGYTRTIEAYLRGLGAKLGEEVSIEP